MMNTRSTPRLGNALITGFCALAEFRDPETGSHLERLSAYVGILCGQLRKLPHWLTVCTPAFADQLCEVVPLHDVGKVGIPDRILLKPGPLTRSEREIMKSHTTLGQQLLLSVRLQVPADLIPVVEMAASVAAEHHERWDGKGYPLGLALHEISPAARITAVADVYDALSTSRVYRPNAIPHRETIDLIRAGRGAEFDPDVVDALTAVEADMERARQQFTDPGWRADQGKVVIHPAIDPNPSVLVVDDDPIIRRGLLRALGKAGFHCQEAETLEDARHQLSHGQFQVVLLDVRLPGESGLTLLEELAARSQETATLVVTGDDSIETGIEALRRGAHDYILKPLNMEQVRSAVARAAESVRLRQEVAAYRVRLEQMVAHRSRELAQALRHRS